MRSSNVWLVVALVLQFLAGSSSTDVKEYRVGIWYPTTKEGVMGLYKLVFQDYLTRVVGPIFNAKFTVMVVDLEADLTAEKMIESNQIDFFYSMAGRMACVEVEYDWIVIASARARALGKEVGAQGTIIYSLKSNTNIKSIKDFKGKRIGLAHMLSASFYLSKQVLQEQGIELFRDAAEVVFYGNDYGSQLQDVLGDKIDVGFTASTVLYQRYADSIPQLTFHAMLTNATFEDEVYPFPTSTPLTPYFSLAASPAVPAAVKREVQRALRNLDANSPEAKAGSLSNFTTPASQFDVRASMEKANLFGARGGGHCFSPFDNLRDLISCPEGYVVDSEKGLERRCEANNLKCPKGFPCYCSPCIRTMSVEVYPSEVVLGLASTLFVVNLAVVVFWAFGIEIGGCCGKPVRALKQHAEAVVRRRRAVPKHGKGSKLLDAFAGSKV